MRGEGAGGYLLRPAQNDEQQKKGRWHMEPTEGTPPKAPALPNFLHVAVRFGTDPHQWPDASGCYERVFQEMFVAEGAQKARRWAIFFGVVFVFAGFLCFGFL